MIDASHLPLVTVVTPSFNQGQFIEQTILSVLNQDYPNVEYLVMDGGSTDDTLDILRKYEHRLWWISEPDKGQSHAINKGFQRACGEIICWLNSDDTYELGAITNAVEILLAHQDVMMVYGGANFIDEKGHCLERIVSNKPFDLWSIVYLEQSIPQPATFFRKSIFNELTLLDEDLHWCMDWDLWIRIGSRFEVKSVSQVYANVRVYSETKTSSGGFKRWFELIYVLKKYGYCVFPFGLIRAGLGAIHMYLKFNRPFLYKCLKSLIYYLKHKTLDDVYRDFHGVHDDGWLGKNARFMFPMRIKCDFIVVNLELPLMDRLIPNKLVVMSNRKVVDRKTLPASGSYKIYIPYDAHSERPTEVALKFSKVLPPDSQRRRLACRLGSVDFIS